MTRRYNSTKSERILIAPGLVDSWSHVPRWSRPEIRYKTRHDRYKLPVITQDSAQPTCPGGRWNVNQAEQGSIVFRCPPELEGIMPRPVPAVRGLPDWFKALPMKAPSQIMGADIYTMKKCTPGIAR